MKGQVFYVTLLFLASLVMGGVESKAQKIKTLPETARFQQYQILNFSAPYPPNDLFSAGEKRVGRLANQSSDSVDWYIREKPRLDRKTVRNQIWAGVLGGTAGGIGFGGHKFQWGRNAPCRSPNLILSRFLRRKDFLSQSQSGAGRILKEKGALRCLNIYPLSRKE